MAKENLTVLKRMLTLVQSDTLTMVKTTLTAAIATVLSKKNGWYS